MSDCDTRSVMVCDGFHNGIELLRQRFDNSRAEPGFWLGKNTVNLSDPIVVDRKLPVRSFDLKGDDDAGIGFFSWKCMLAGIHDEFRRDQA